MYMFRLHDRLTRCMLFVFEHLPISGFFGKKFGNRWPTLCSENEFSMKSGANASFAALTPVGGTMNCYCRPSLAMNCRNIYVTPQQRRLRRKNPESTIISIAYSKIHEPNRVIKCWKCLARE